MCVVGVLEQDPALAGGRVVETDTGRSAAQERRVQQRLPAGKQPGQATDQLAGSGVGLAQALAVAPRDGGLPETGELERREEHRAVGPPRSTPETRGGAERLRQAAGQGELLQPAVRREGDRRAVRREEGTEAVLRALDRRRVEGVELAKVEPPCAVADGGVDEARPVRRERHEVLHERHVDHLDVAPAQAGDREPEHGLRLHGYGSAEPGGPDGDAGQAGRGEKRDEHEAAREAGAGPRPARRRSVLWPIAGSPKRLVDLETGVRDVVEPLVRALSETPPQEASNPSRRLGGQSLPRRVVLHHRREDVGHRLPGERPAARQQLEEERPEGPDVRPLVHPPPASLLGRHVARRPEDQPRLGAGLRQGRGSGEVRGGAHGRVPGISLRQAEVENLDLALRRQLHVGGLEVAVHDRLLVRSLQGLGDLLRDLERFADGQPSPLEALGQVLPFHQLEDEEGPPVRFFEAVDRRDVRVVESREELRLTSEAGQALGIGRYLDGQHLDRHLAVELRVGGAVDLSHAAGADGGGDLVRPEARAGGEAQIAAPVCLSGNDGHSTAVTVKDRTHGRAGSRFERYRRASTCGRRRLALQCS